MKITIPKIPPSDNKFKGRKNVWEYREAKKEWHDIVAIFSKRPPKPFGKAEVRITYFFPTRGRRDPDNYSGKFILDGLVNHGILKDDSFSCIDLVLRGSYDKTNPRTEIEITET
jgi:Holliday junction resolvase